MKKLALASALLSVVAITGTAHAYQAEFGVNGKYYFKPVQTRNAPLAEAAFLDRASNVSAHATFADRGDVDDNTYGAGVEYFVPNSDFYLSGDISRNNLEVKTPLGKRDFDTTYYAAEVGYLPAPGFLVAAGVKGYDNDNDSGADPTIRAKYVTTLSNGKDINLEAGASFVKADYFIDKTFSVGADYYNNDLTDRSEVGINARKFINQQVSLEGRVGFGEAGKNDYNSFGVAAKYRF